MATIPAARAAGHRSGALFRHTEEHFGREDADFPQELKRAPVIGLRPDFRIKAGHGFDVVIQDVRSGSGHRPQGGLVTAKIGDEELDADIRDGLSQGEHDAAEHDLEVEELEHGHCPVNRAHS